MPLSHLPRGFGMGTRLAHSVMRRLGERRTRSGWMRDPWLPEHEPNDDELADLFAPAREAWRGAVHLEGESWRRHDEAWRGDGHLDDSPEPAAGPAYRMVKGRADRSQ